MELDAEARRILSLARDARTPSADDKARLEERLTLALAASTAAATTSLAAKAGAAEASGAAVKAASAGAALKWTLGGCVLIATALGAYAALPARSPAALPSAAERVAKPALPVAPVAAAASAPSSEVSSSAAPAPAPAPAPARAADAAPARHAHLRPHAERDALGDELELLHAAQSAWRAGAAARALALVSEHAARHPRSALGIERDALRVLALCDLGRKDEAARLGRAWLARASGSPLRASIERSCAMK